LAVRTDKEMIWMCLFPEVNTNSQCLFLSIVLALEQSVCVCSM
jgi:hypothetical protein